MSAYLTKEEVRLKLNALIDATPGGVPAISKKLDLNAAYIRNVAKGKVSAGPKISAALGLEKGERLYRKLEEK